jgi:hypothetical protein
MSTATCAQSHVPHDVYGQTTSLDGFSSESVLLEYVWEQNKMKLEFLEVKIKSLHIILQYTVKEMDK